MFYENKFYNLIITLSNVFIIVRHDSTRTLSIEYQTKNLCNSILCNEKLI